jgi:hypothetical protein
MHEAQHGSTAARGAAVGPPPSLTVDDIVAGLRHYENRFRWLVVFVRDLDEVRRGDVLPRLTESTEIPEPGAREGTRRLHAVYRADLVLDIEWVPDQEAARFGLRRARGGARRPIPPGGPDPLPWSVLEPGVERHACQPGLALLLGGLSARAPYDPPDMNRILSLRLERPGSVQPWIPYDGPFVGYLKCVLGGCG